MDAMAPTSWVEFADAFMVACDQGESALGEPRLDSLVEDVKRLREQSRAPTATPFRLAADNYYAKRDYCHTFPEAGSMSPAEESYDRSLPCCDQRRGRHPCLDMGGVRRGFPDRDLRRRKLPNRCQPRKLAEDARRLRYQEASLVAAPAPIPSGFALKQVAVESAKAALDQYREGTFYPAAIIPGYVPEEIEAKERELDAVYWAALEAALAHPCHSVTDLLDKLKVVAAADAWELTAAQNGLEADLGRITGGQA